MFFLATATSGVKNVDISGGEAALVAGLGYATVFLGLIFLMVLVMCVGKAFGPKAVKAQPVVAAEPVPAAPAPTAPGSAGQLTLYNTDPKTAAMLMAIVADKMGKPLNELRFISIKEVK